MKAVLTGDLIDSTHYELGLLSTILDTLKEELQYLEEVYGCRGWMERGDSLQVLTSEPGRAFQFALLLKAAVNKIGGDEGRKSGRPEADIRLFIGLGEVDMERASLAESAGEAFQLSGRGLDELKRKRINFGIQGPDAGFNAEMDVSCHLLDAVMKKWSIASAEVVYWRFRGLQRQQQIADRLGVLQSSVQRRMEVLGWSAVEAFADRYQLLVQNMQR